MLIDVHPFPSGIAATSAGFLFPVAGFDRNLTPCDFFSAPSGGAERNCREIARLRSSRVSFFFCHGTSYGMQKDLNVVVT